LSGSQDSNGTGLERSPGRVLEDIQRVCDELIQAGEDYTRDRVHLAGAELVYEQRFAQELLKVYNQGKVEGKIPAEDVRKAMAHALVPGEIWSEFLTTKAKVEAKKIWIGTRQAVLSALQSELQQLRVEFTHA